MAIKTSKLSDFTGGWFVGNFNPSLNKNEHFEIAVKHYPAGAKEQRHVHRVAVEYTIITKGCVMMNGIKYFQGDIIVVPPGESTDFEALDDVCTTVVKTPSVRGDKYYTSL